MHDTPLSLPSPSASASHTGCSITATETQDGEAKEPTVSILPVPPVAPVEPEILDPLPVIGKSADQVKEAIAGLEHEEL